MKDRWRGWLFVLVLLFLLQAGCSLPHDPRNTTEMVRNNVMVVGVSENPPWVVRSEDTPQGIEVQLVEQFAQQMNAEVEWQWGSLAQLLEALHQHELHLVIGGLTTTTPGTRVAGLTQPYYESQIIVALPAGVAPLDDLSGARIGVVRGTALADDVRDEGAEPVFFSDWQDIDLPAAVPSWQTEEWHLAPSNITLRTVRHTMAVPPGENRWLTELEMFLMQQSVNP